MPSLILPARTVRPATPRTRIITLDLGSHTFPFRAGQAVHAGLAAGAVRRAYSIACSPTQSRSGNMIELLVQIDDHSPPDPHLEQAVAGTPMAVDGPFGSFALPTPVAESQVLLVAGGTGIAPLRSMLWELLETQPELAIAVIYSARRADEFAYRDELAELADRGRIDLHLRTTRDGDADRAGGRGRIDDALIHSMVKTAATRAVVCGPPSFVSDTVDRLVRSGVARDRIGWESDDGQ